MSRARQVANFDPALFAADEVSGDKVQLILACTQVC